MTIGARQRIRGPAQKTKKNQNPFGSPRVLLTRTDIGPPALRKGSPMQLHTFVGSPNGRKVEAVINHLKLPVEIRYHDFFAKDLRRPDYLAINPNAMVPALVDDTFILWESDAIIQYLADRAEDLVLFPRDPRRRAEVVRWQFWAGIHFNKAFGTVVFEALVKPKLNIGPTNAAALETAQQDLARFAPVLDGHLKGRKFLVGNDMTIADYAMIKLEPYQMSMPFDWTSFADLNAYFARMRQVEAWTRTAPPSFEAIGRKPAKAA
jgi:glutathione S-transferase